MSWLSLRPAIVSLPLCQQMRREHSCFRLGQSVLEGLKNLIGSSLLCSFIESSFFRISIPRQRESQVQARLSPRHLAKLLIQAFQLSVMCIIVSIIITIIVTIMIMIMILIMTFTPSSSHFFTEKLVAQAPDAFRAPRLSVCSGGTLPFKQTCQPRTRHIQQRAVPKLLIPCQYCRMFRIMSSQTCSSHRPALHLIQPPLLAGVLPAWEFK